MVQNRIKTDHLKHLGGLGGNWVKGGLTKAAPCGFLLGRVRRLGAWTLAHIPK